MVVKKQHSSRGPSTAIRVRGGSPIHGDHDDHRRHDAPAPPRGERGGLERESPRGGHGGRVRAPPCRLALAHASPPERAPSARGGGARCALCMGRGLCGARCGDRK